MSIPTMPGTVIVIKKIADLKENLFVRQALNQDHAIHLAELIEGGTKLPPIKITKDGTIVDGRHRVEAHHLLNLTEIEAVIVDLTDPAEIIAEAYRSNVGGPLPPTSSDTEHTIATLLKQGESRKRIGDLLEMPGSILRRYVEIIESKRNRLNIQKAITAIANDGLTVPQAAERYEVEADKVRAVISGRKKKAKNDVESIKRRLSTAYRSQSMKNSSIVKDLFEKLEDGDIKSEDMKAILIHLQQLQKRSARSLTDWINRFKAKT